MVRVGTPISKLLEAVGGLPEDTGKVISGGPMMGKALKNIDAPVTKGTSGVLVLPNKMAERKKADVCSSFAQVLCVLSHPFHRI